MKFVSPGKGISGLEFNNFKNRKLYKAVNKNQYVSIEDFDKNTGKKFERNKIYTMNKKWD